MLRGRPALAVVGAAMLVLVTGNAVEVLESGYGQSPWDPAKTVVTDWWVD